MHSLPRAVQQLRPCRSRSRLPTALPCCCGLKTAVQVHPSDEWRGLTGWRDKGVDRGWWWGDKGPSQQPSFGSEPYQSVPLPSSLLQCGLLVLSTADPCGKSALTHRAWEAYNTGAIPLGAACKLAPADRPARPKKPELLTPRQVPSIKASPLPLNAHVLHNLAHIELNAIDLAWDTAVRFADLDLNPSFYEDFVRVADDESRHLGWCLQRLHELGHAYGDMPAHDLLWQGAQMSAHDLNARLAMVPMTQEARGLDAGERLATRLVGWGDNRSAAIVKRIAEEEKAHVAVGVTWFRRVCAALSIDEGPAFRQWIQRLAPDVLKGPFNHPAREEVGLPRDWYDPERWPNAQPKGTPAVKPAASQQSSSRNSSGTLQAHIPAARLATTSLSLGEAGSACPDTANSQAAAATVMHPQSDDGTPASRVSITSQNVFAASATGDVQQHGDGTSANFRSGVGGCAATSTSHDELSGEEVSSTCAETAEMLGGALKPGVSAERLQAVKQQLAGMLELEGVVLPADT